MRRIAPVLISLALGAGMAAGVSSVAVAGDAPAREAAQVRPEVVIKVDKTLVEVGKKVSVTGKIDMPKSVAGDRVIIKQKTGDKPWKTQDRVRVTKKGKFTWTDKPSTPQARKYKVVLPKTKKHSEATSNAVKVVAAQWRRFTWRDVAIGEQTYFSEVTVGGDTYEDSPASSFYEEDRVGFLEVNLFRKCFSLRTAAALTDSAESNSTGTVRVLLDGDLDYTQDVSELGRVLPARLDLTDIYRMRIEFESTSPEHLAQVALLSPEALCTR